MKKEIKVLIIGSTPYSCSSQTRSFETYLYHWKNQPTLVRQIYTRPVVPSFEYCNSYYQITDKMMIKSLFCSKKRGIILNKNDDLDFGKNTNDKLDLTTGHFFTSFSKNKTPFKRLIRGMLWGRKRWLSKKLINWIDEFCPDIVFLNFGDDFHLFRMSNWVAERYNIPIITVVSDDYYFSLLKSKNVFSIIYRKRYYKMLKKLFFNKRNAIAFNSKKIQNKYVDHFDISNFDLVSISNSGLFENIKESNKIINKKTTISYFGNFEFGRYKTLLLLADSLNDDYVLNVCGSCKDEKIVKKISSHPHINYFGVVPYRKTINIAKDSDYLLVVESFDKKDFKGVEYALSTKIADYLSSRIPIIAVGDNNCGAIQYLKENNAAVICDDKNNLSQLINNLISVDTKPMVECASRLSKTNHDLASNGDKFFQLCLKAINVSKGEKNND